MSSLYLPLTRGITIIQHPPPYSLVVLAHRPHKEKHHKILGIPYELNISMGEERQRHRMLIKQTVESTYSIKFCT